MTEVGRVDGFCGVAALHGRFWRVIGDGAGAWFGASLAECVRATAAGCANPRYAAALVPASDGECGRAIFVRFAPQSGANSGGWLGSAVVVAPSRDKIRQKVIGPTYGGNFAAQVVRAYSGLRWRGLLPGGMRRICAGRWIAGSEVRARSRTFHQSAFPLAVLHKPAREHGRGILLNPLIDQRGNF